MAPPKKARRPAKLQASIPADLVAWLEERAAAKAMTRSEYLTHALDKLRDIQERAAQSTPTRTGHMRR